MHARLSPNLAHGRAQILCMNHAQRSKAPAAMWALRKGQAIIFHDAHAARSRVNDDWRATNMREL
jgi:hypothetical protein